MQSVFMGLLYILNHLLNFAAPAAAMALLPLLSAPLLRTRGPAGLPLWARCAIVFAVGLATLAAGLLLLGRDGRMLTYSALVLACASCQWVLLRGWRH